MGIMLCRLPAEHADFLDLAFYFYYFKNQVIIKWWVHRGCIEIIQLFEKGKKVSSLVLFTSNSEIQQNKIQHSIFNLS